MTARSHGAGAAVENVDSNPPKQPDYATVTAVKASKRSFHKQNLDLYLTATNSALDSALCARYSVKSNVLYSYSIDIIIESLSKHHLAVCWKFGKEAVQHVCRGRFVVLTYLRLRTSHVNVA